MLVPLLFPSSPKMETAAVDVATCTTLLSLSLSLLLLSLLLWAASEVELIRRPLPLSLSPTKRIV